MRRFFAAMLFVFPLFAIDLFLQVPSLFCQSPEDKQSFAVVSITTSQAGLPVFVDGTHVGVTPLQHLPLPAGEHEIAVRLNQSDSWLDADWIEKYHLLAGDTLEIHPRFKRGYMINSKPFGAEVFLDGMPQGTTPVVVYVTDHERREVELQLGGYDDFSFAIDSTSQRLWNVTLREDKDRMHAEMAGVQGKTSRRAHFRRLSMAAAGMSAVSGVTAVLLKRRADGYYQDYLSAGDPRALESFYNKTNQYDEYAGTAFIVFQASFVMSFYWFLRSTAE